MTEKKEVQEKIIELKGEPELTKDEFLIALRLVSPGTHLRTALDGIVKLGKGALIVVENDQTDQIIDGGFKMNTRFTPQRLIELAKMDGAILLSKDMKRITHTNVLLTPDHKIPTNETGTRHKAAERTAKMTGTLVIAVSERKNEINIYLKNKKYLLKDTNEIVRKLTGTLQILEKQREQFDDKLSILDRKELKNKTDIQDVCNTLQRGKAIHSIIKRIEENLIELGNEDHSIKSRIKELTKGIEKETDLIIKDYTRLNLKKSKKLLDLLTYEELLNHENIIKSLGRSSESDTRNIKGWRMLSKVGFSEKESSELIESLQNLPNILKSNKVIYQKIAEEYQEREIKNPFEFDNIRQQI